MVKFSTNLETCIEQIQTLGARAEQFGADLVFQNVPCIVSAALCEMVDGNRSVNVDPDFGPLSVSVGVVIGMPRERQVAVSKLFQILEHPELPNNSQDEIRRLIEFLNPYATVDINIETGFLIEDEFDEVVSITVANNPVAPFVFDRIQWM